MNQDQRAKLIDLGLKPFQIEAVMSASLDATSWAPGMDRGVIKAPTGAGKTFIIKGLASVFSENYYVVITTSKKIISSQIHKSLESSFGDSLMSPQDIESGKAEPKRILVINPNSLGDSAKNQQKKVKNVLDRIPGKIVLIRDEEDAGQEGKRGEALKAFIGTKLVYDIGLTATPKPEARVIFKVGRDDLINAQMIVKEVIAPRDNAIKEATKHSILQKAMELQQSLSAEVSESSYLPQVVVYCLAEEAQEWIEFIRNTYFEGDTSSVIGCTSDDEFSELDYDSKEALLKKAKVIVGFHNISRGWDRPEAKILVSMFNEQESSSSLTQLIGRVVRQPKQIYVSNDDLNHAYVYIPSSHANRAVDALNKDPNGGERPPVVEKIEERLVSKIDKTLVINGIVHKNGQDIETIPEKSWNDLKAKIVNMLKSLAYSETNSSEIIIEMDRIDITSSKKRQYKGDTITLKRNVLASFNRVKNASSLVFGQSLIESVMNEISDKRDMELLSNSTETLVEKLNPKNMDETVFKVLSDNLSLIFKKTEVLLPKELLMLYSEKDTLMSFDFCLYGKVSSLKNEELSFARKIDTWCRQNSETSTEYRYFWHRNPVRGAGLSNFYPDFVLLQIGKKEGQLENFCFIEMKNTQNVAAPDTQKKISLMERINKCFGLQTFIFVSKNKGSIFARHNGLNYEDGQDLPTALSEWSK